jgi:hypothetical protein
MSRFKHITKDFASAVDDRYAALYTRGRHATHEVVASAARCRPKENCPPPPPPPPPVNANYPTFSHCVNELTRYNDYEIDDIEEKCNIWIDKVVETELTSLVWTMFWGNEDVVNSTFGSKDNLVDTLVNSISAVRLNLTEYHIHAKDICKKWEADAKARTDEYIKKKEWEEVVLGATTVFSLVTMWNPFLSFGIGISGSAVAAWIDGSAEDTRSAVEEIVSSSIDDEYLTEQGRGIKAFMGLLEIVAYMAAHEDKARWDYIGQVCIFYVAKYAASGAEITRENVRDDLDQMQETIIDLQQGYAIAMFNETFHKPSREEVVHAMLANKMAFLADLMVLTAAGFSGLVTTWNWATGLIRLRSLRQTDPRYFNEKMDETITKLVNEKAELIKKVEMWDKLNKKGIKTSRPVFPRKYPYEDAYENKGVFKSKVKGDGTWGAYENVEWVEARKIWRVDVDEKGNVVVDENGKPVGKIVDEEAGYRIKAGKESTVLKELNKNVAEDKYLISKTNTESARFTKASTASKALGVVMGVATIASMITLGYEAVKTRDLLIKNIEAKVKYTNEQLDSTVESLQVWNDTM